MRCRTRSLLILLIACVAAGCAGPHGADRIGVDADTGEPVPWPYWPAGMRIHPLSRLVRDGESGQTVIEARIEFVDRDGHTSRACGQLRIDLHDATAAFPAGPVVTWEMDLRDLATNRRRYDDVTRTYLFPLDTEVDPFPQQPELRAYFLSADGRKLSEDALRLRTE
ncbi:MAG: hypothetical protein SYC29_16705 [Planctomycetota bacterium]|nr:hypothetical protein [Planctomycetota bacterium]